MKKRVFLISLISIFFLITLTSFAFGANSQASTDFYEYATVDTAPGASGYGTNAVNIRSTHEKHAWFSIRGTGVMTVTLQFKCPGDTDWTDYMDYSSTERKLIEGGGAGVKWRAIVKNAEYTSGSKTFGFDW